MAKLRERPPRNKGFAASLQTNADYPDRPMTSNYDPKPGRWMLPMVVLAMVAFTYLFVRELPSAATTSTEPTNGTTSTTGTTLPGETTTTLPTDAAGYIDTLTGFQTRLTDLQTQLSAANSGFDARPRTVTYDQAQAAFVAVRDAAAALAAEVEATAPPEGYADAHQAVVSAATQAASAANDALTGLQAPAPDTGEGRRAGVAAFDAAAAAFATAVEGVRTLAAG
jgi:hypothetical protein